MICARSLYGFFSRIAASVELLGNLLRVGGAVCLFLLVPILFFLIEGEERGGMMDRLISEIACCFVYEINWTSIYRLLLFK